MKQLALTIIIMLILLGFFLLAAFIIATVPGIVLGVVLPVAVVAIASYEIAADILESRK